MKIYIIKGTNLAFKTKEDAINFQKFCNNHLDIYSFIDDSDIEEYVLTTYEE